MQVGEYDKSFQNLYNDHLIPNEHMLWNKKKKNLKHAQCNTPCFIMFFKDF